jgi:hypothetical protein
MEDTTTTAYNRIYTNPMFDKLSCEDKLYLLVHEITHVVQSKADPTFFTKYGFNKNLLAIYEAECEGAMLQLLYLMDPGFKKLVDLGCIITAKPTSWYKLSDFLDDRLLRFKSYGVSNTDLNVMKASLMSDLISVSRDVTTSKVARKVYELITAQQGK